MDVALNLITAIYTGLFNFLFSSYIADRVSLGMIVVVVIVFSLMISNLLNTPVLSLKERAKVKYELSGRNK